MKTIDFQGIVSLDRPLVDNLSIYLQERESKAAHAIVHAIHLLSHAAATPILPSKASGEIKLSEAIELFSKNIGKITLSDQSLVSAVDWESTTHQINGAIWEYVEVLDGCVTELFQQLGQVGFEGWHAELIKVVETIKDKLNFRMEELFWTIKRLDALLWDYRLICETKSGNIIWLRKIWRYFKSLLDRALVPYLRRSQKFLKLRFYRFSNRYVAYQTLQETIEQSLRKLKGYHIFKLLDDSAQDGIRKLFRLIKLWKLNQKSKSLPQRETARALRAAASVERAKGLFKDYTHELRKALFDRSRKCKYDPKELYFDTSNRRIVGEILKGFRSELHMLGVSVAHYREFLISTHPNPYIRSKWGFAEWMVGPEPQQSKEFLSLVYEIEMLGKQFESLEESVKKGPSAFDSLKAERQYRDIERVLHEMGQPLTTQTVLRHRAQKMLEMLLQMDELGSFIPEMVDYTAAVLSKAMRADWQYHVLFDFPLFHQLYAVHQGIVKPIEERVHVNRMKTFEEIISRLKGWIKNRDIHRHVHEIETDMHDIKGYLQDFFGFVQRIEKEADLEPAKAKEKLPDLARQLLECRYLFGNFFHYLHQHEPEGKNIRNQFLFVDQYFESIENKLQEIPNIWI